MSPPPHPAVLAIWAKRLGSEEAARRFLAPDRSDVPGSTALRGMAEAVERIGRALAKRERIAVFGHDDPDGITSCALVVETLETLGAKPLSYIPDRDEEGHGLYPALVRSFATDGVTLLVTTDGCSANVAEAELAGSLGMDVLVTDHHVLAEGRPAVAGLVNPLADPETARTLGDLTGAGVAALLAKELLRRAGRPEAEFAKRLDLVALGTVADHGDVGRNNRALVAHGLAACARGDRPAVAEAARRLGLRDPFPEEAARRLAAVFASVPSVAGRSRGLNALLARGAWREDVAALVEELGRREEEMERATERGWDAAREAGVPDGAPAVLRLDDVPVRMLGAVAASLARRTGRPAAVLCGAGGSIVGELRGPDGVHLVEVLAAMQSLLESWGGHRRAAGFSAARARAAEVERRLAEALDVPPEVTPEPAPEAELPARDVDERLLRTLAAARPFGKGNPEPRLTIDGEIVGAEELLARMTTAEELR